MSSPSATPPGADAPVTGQAWRLLALLTALSVLNFVDRQLIASLAPLLIDELGLTRAQIGLLAGFAFVVFYTVSGLFLGMIADRSPRLRLIALGLALWSAMTAASGAAQRFAHIAAARVLVGIGEATLTPAALSILGDVFPRSRLGLATGIYYAGIPMGTALSLLVAGWIAPAHGWRVCFYVLGLLGLALVGVLWVIPEPPRRAIHVSTVAPGARAIIAALCDALNHGPALVLVLLGGTALTFWASANLLNITWLVQERGFDFRRAAFTAGFIAAAAGFLGNLFGGWFGDWCAGRWRGGRAWSMAIMSLALAPAGAVFFLMPTSSPFFYACWFLTSASTTAWFGPLFAAIQHLAPPAIRSTTVAFALLVLNLFGVGPGPWITGLIGDASSLTRGLVLAAGVQLAAAVPLVLAACWMDRHGADPHRPKLVV
jgi:MFS family permease